MPTARPQIPGFDGLRGCALLSVLCFHQGFGWAQGGFLGVSTFFTLSGFLIARVTFVEALGTGRVRLAAFWVRRARRLVPAALLTIAGTAVVCRLVDLGPVDEVRLDLLAALGWVVNWRFVAEGSSYRAIFAAPSPVQHFWSLSIEEQFYLVFPLASLAIAGLARRRWVVVTGVIAAASVAGFGLAAWVASGSPTAAYYGTHTRAAELLAGVGLAAATMTPGFPGWIRRHGSRLGILGLGGLGVLAGLVITESFRSATLFRGATALNSLATLALILACLVPGPTATALSWGPMRSIGRVSYGAYLYHWPVFLVLAEPRVHLSAIVLFGLRVSVTFLLAYASAVLIEEPIRFGSPRQPSWIATTAGSSIVLVAAMVVVLLPSTPADPTGPYRVTAALPDDPEQSRVAAVVPASLPPAAQPVLHVLLSGDSIAYTSVLGLETWNDRHPLAPLELDTDIHMGCPLIGWPVIRLLKHRTPVFAECQDAIDELAVTVAVNPPDVVVYLAGLADLADQRLHHGWHHLGEPEVDARLSSRLDALIAASGAARVVLVVPPPLDPRNLPSSVPPPPYPEADPTRAAQLRNLLLAAAGRHPDSVVVIDLGAWCDARADRCMGPDFRPDGIHFSRPGAIAVADWLMPQVRLAARG